MDSIEQLGAISALIGGLAFVSASSLLAVGASSREAKSLDWAASLTVICAVACAAAQIVAAIAWALLAIHVESDLLNEETASRLGRWVSLALTFGVILLFASIGVSSWISSKRLGIVTGVIGMQTGFITVFVISHFIH